MNLPVPCSEPPRRNCPVRASWRSTVKREKYSNQSIEDGRPLLVDRPHQAAGNASRRVQGRVDVLLHIAHETKENMLTVDVDGQVIKRVAHLAREVLRSHHESTESVAISPQEAKRAKSRKWASSLHLPTSLGIGA